MHGGIPAVRGPWASAADLMSQVALCLAECVLQDGLRTCGAGKKYFIFCTVLLYIEKAA